MNRQTSTKTCAPRLGRAANWHGRVGSHRAVGRCKGIRRRGSRRDRILPGRRRGRCRRTAPRTDDRAARLVRTMLAGGKYPEAKYLLRMAAIAAGKSNEPALVKEIDTRQAEAEATRAEFDTAQVAHHACRQSGGPRRKLATRQLRVLLPGELGSRAAANRTRRNWRSVGAGASRIAGEQSAEKLAEVANDWWNIADAETGVPANKSCFTRRPFIAGRPWRSATVAAKAEATQRLREVAQMPDAPIELRACSWCRILNRATGQYLAVSEGSRNRGHGVIQWPATGDADQQWQIEFNAQGCARSRIATAAWTWEFERGAKHRAWMQFNGMRTDTLGVCSASAENMFDSLPCSADFAWMSTMCGPTNRSPAQAKRNSGAWNWFLESQPRRPADGINFVLRGGQVNCWRHNVEDLAAVF